MSALLTGNAVLLFVNVFAEQLGAPLPSYPFLVASGASATGSTVLTGFLLLASLACVLADLVWYWAGLRHGDKILGWLAKLPFSHRENAGTCSARFTRRGAQWLLISKFVPGMGAVATLMAGAQKMSLVQFLVYDVLGSALWAGSALMLGHVFQAPVLMALDMLQEYLLPGLAATGLLLALTLLVLHQLRSRRLASRLTQQAATYRLQSVSQPFVKRSASQPAIPTVETLVMTTPQDTPSFRRTLHTARYQRARPDASQWVHCRARIDPWQDWHSSAHTLQEAS
jgi:membrane protein DedA with SNARE-associated domain